VEDASGSRKLPSDVWQQKRALVVRSPAGLPMARGSRQEADGAISPGSRTADKADVGGLPKLRESPVGRCRWLQQVSVASTTRPPKVGDASNGQPTSSRKARFRCSRSGVGGGIGQGATGRAAQVVGLGVGTPTGARDNRSRLQKLVRGISLEWPSGGNVGGRLEIAVGGDPSP